jgi:hypothetical protein
MIEKSRVPASPLGCVLESWAVLIDRRGCCTYVSGIGGDVSNDGNGARSFTVSEFERALHSVGVERNETSLMSSVFG